jgi:deazaflavin-dependent oxidoreductase (nitroreductase family)
MTVTVRGRRTGRPITLPVQYAEDGDAVWVLVGEHARKSWWRNLRTEQDVAVGLRGRRLVGRARAVVGADEPELAAAGLRAHAARFPQRGPGRAVDGVVLVRIDLGPDHVAPVPPEGGRGLRGRVRAHRLGVFHALAFALAWGYWVPVALAGGRWSHFPGLLAPAVAALAVAGLADGRAGVRRLAARAVRGRVAPRWYLLALSPLVVALLVAGVLALTGAPFAGWAAFTRVSGLPDLGAVGVLLLLLVVNGFGEELGWRGYALPEFRRWHRPLQAAVLVALPWLLWHAPLFFIDSGFRGSLDPVVLPGFVIGLLAGSILLTWLYEGSGGSVLLVALWHACYNAGVATEAGEGVVAVVVTATVIAAAFRAGRVLHRSPDDVPGPGA